MKKTLKIILFILAGLILLIILGSYICYKTYRAKDPVTETNTTLLKYYHSTYDECRKVFIQNIERVSADFDSVLTGKFSVPSQIDNDLTVDWCYIPARGTKEKLLMVNSGLHGIEGFTGSAIQNMFIDRILEQHLHENMGVLLIHGLNPFGFKYHRKVTENNIDLNRNCVRGDQMFDIRNEGFAALTDMLMPSGPVNINSLRNQFFHLVSIYRIIRESMPVLRQAALQGQYDFEKGFYYGGKDYEPQIDSLKPFLIDIIRRYKTLLNVDLHTAYGERGTMHLFIDEPEDEAVRKGIEKIFAGADIDWGSSDDFYTITGEYTVWVNDLVPEVLCIPMVFEFGTLNSQETFGSLKSIQIMILENQGAHYGYRNIKHEEKTKHLFDEMYFPSSAVWRSKVIADSFEMMSKMMKNFEEFESE